MPGIPANNTLLLGSEAFPFSTGRDALGTVPLPVFLGLGDSSPDEEDDSMGTRTVLSLIPGGL